MKRMMLLLLSYVCLFNFFSSAMDSKLELITTDNKTVTFFADYTGSTSALFRDIYVDSNRKNIMLSRRITERDAIVFSLKEELPQHVTDTSLPRFVEYDENVYQLGLKVFISNKEPKKSPSPSQWNGLPTKLFVTTIFFVCIIALLRYFDCRTRINFYTTF